MQIPIPKSVDKNGGTFEVVLGTIFLNNSRRNKTDLLPVSVEDKYKCKRTLEPRSLVVNVRRVKASLTLNLVASHLTYILVHCQVLWGHCEATCEHLGRGYNCFATSVDW